MSNSVTNHDDIIDSRDVIERLQYLRDLLGDGGHTDIEDAELDEIMALAALTDEAVGYSEDWNYGALLIRDTYFETYALDMADEIGALPSAISWPYTCIDWTEAADQLKADYTCVDFGGVDYWVR